MPSWAIHIKIANEVNKKFNIDEDLFKFGSIMPDNRGFIVKGLSNLSTYNNSHFASHQKIGNVEFNLPDKNKYLKEYIINLDNPLVLGCFVHIVTDYFFNFHTFKYKYYVDDVKNVIGIRLVNNQILYTDKETMKVYKQGDFEKYARKIYKVIEPNISQNMIDKIYKNCGIIQEIKYSKDDVAKTVKYLNNLKNIYSKRDYMKINYHIYSEQDLENMTNKCTEYVENQIEKFLELKKKIV